MTLHEVSLGSAPDYVMKSGRIAIYHAASIEVFDGQEPRQSFSFSHLSFFMLLKEIAEQSVALGIRDAIGIQWAKVDGIGLEFISRRLLVKVEYRIHPGLMPRKAKVLNIEFKKYLQCFLPSKP